MDIKISLNNGKACLKKTIKRKLLNNKNDSFYFKLSYKLLYSIIITNIELLISWQSLTDEVIICSKGCIVYFIIYYSFYNTFIKNDTQNIRQRLDLVSYTFNIQKLKIIFLNEIISFIHLKYWQSLHYRNYIF